jgi:hypothetical protein
MRTFGRTIMLVSLLFVIGASDGQGPKKIAVLDDCATDPGWTPSGGCALADGEVTFAEFNAEGSFGHPAWRFEPSYVKFASENANHIDVANTGGRRHTFTRVAAFGGGFLVPFNGGRPTATECMGGFANPGVAASDMPPGAERRIEGLDPGIHRFQCCIHPWMKTEVRVK